MRVVFACIHTLFFYVDRYTKDKFRILRARPRLLVPWAYINISRTHPLLFPPSFCNRPGYNQTLPNIWLGIMCSWCVTRLAGMPAVGVGLPCDYSGELIYSFIFIYILAPLLSPFWRFCEKIPYCLSLNSLLSQLLGIHAHRGWGLGQAFRRYV